MPELHMTDEATRFVLGELSPAERRRFEAQLEQSEELRAHVRELEEGAAALALTVPRRQPPKQVWEGIERALARETHASFLTSLFRARFWRSGWAVATACLVGWGLSLFYLHGPEASRAPSAPLVAEMPHPPAAEGAELLQPRAAEPARPAMAVDKTAPQVLQAKAREISALRWQVADLSNRVQHLSQTLTQERALASSPGQLRFFQLTPTSGPAAPPAMVSTNLQRALFLAMARELGWLGPAAPWDFSQPMTNHPPVEFVDLRPGSNTVAQSTTPPTESEPPKASTPSDRASLPAGSVPGFVSGNSFVLAFDSSIVPSGTSLNFWLTNPSGESQPIGDATAGEGTTVVLGHLSTGNGTPGTLTLSTLGTGGAATTYQFSPVGASPP